MRYGTKWPEYRDQWNSMEIKPSVARSFSLFADRAFKHAPQYKAVEAKTGVPWFLFAAIHNRESSMNFDTYFGNGQSLHRVTTIVPKGRGPFRTFEDGCIDACRIDRLDRVVDWRLEKILYEAEIFNGTGYNGKEMPSPYVWGGTSIQVRGKFVSDGHFDSAVWDTQLGIAGMIKTIAEHDPSIVLVRED